MTEKREMTKLEEPLDKLKRGLEREKTARFYREQDIRVLRLLPTDNADEAAILKSVILGKECQQRLDEWAAEEVGA